MSVSLRAADPCLIAEDGSCLPAPQLVKANPVTYNHERHAVAQETAILVKRKSNVTPANFRAELQALGLRNIVGLTVKGWWRVPVPLGESADQLINRLTGMHDVQLVEKDGMMQASFTPNDPYFSLYQWGPQQIQAPTVWDMDGGSPGVWLAVVDSGIDYNHPDSPYFLYRGYNFVNNTADPYDDYMHGTHVAGIVAAAANNSVGIAGLCYYCGLLAVKVMEDSSGGSYSNIASGIEYAAYWGQQYGKKTIINLSLGSPYYSAVIAQAVSDAQGMGALVIAAAGNNGPGLPSYPAALPGVVAVAATDPLDNPASFSQYGSIAAPGVNILSTVPGWYTYPPYTYSSGTSMAAPHVAGAAGLVWSLFPGCTSYSVAAELESTVDIPPGWNANYGSGRLDVNNAILRFTSSTLPSANTGFFYNSNIYSFGGAGSKSYTVVSGALPPGIGLSNWGWVYGTPSQPGVYTFYIRVSDGICEYVDRQFSIAVYAPVFLPIVAKNTGG